MAVHPLKETLKSSTEAKSGKKAKDQPIKSIDGESVAEKAAKKGSKKEVTKSASDSATNETTSASTTHTITTTKTAPATGTSLTHITPIHGSGSSRSNLVIAPSELGTFRTLLSGWETVTSGAVNASSSSLNTNFESSSLRSSSSLGGMLNARTSALANREFFLYGNTSSCETSPTSFNYPTYPNHMTTFSTFKPNTISDSYTSGSSSGPSYRHASVDRLNSRRGIYDRNFNSINNDNHHHHLNHQQQQNHINLQQQQQSSHPLFSYSLHVPSIENVNNPINSVLSYGLPCNGSNNKGTFGSSEASSSKLNEPRGVNCDFLNTRVSTSNESTANDLLKEKRQHHEQQEGEERKKGEEQDEQEEFSHKEQMKLHMVTVAGHEQPAAVNLLHQTKQQQGTHGKFKVTTVTVHPQGSIESSLPSSTSPPTVTLGVTKTSTTAVTTATAATGNSLLTNISSPLINRQLSGGPHITGPPASLLQPNCNGSTCLQSNNYCSNIAVNDAAVKDDLSGNKSMVQPGPRMSASASLQEKVDPLDHFDAQSTTSNESIGFSLFPQQLYKKIIKKGFKFNLMVVGESGTGKSTAINSLFLTDIYSSEYPGPTGRTSSNTLSIESTRVQLKEGDVKIDLTLVDTPGFAASLDNTDCWKPMVSFIESKFEQFMAYEGQVHRSQVPDNRIHALLYFIAPTGHSLKQLDIEVMKKLSDRVNLIPIISKADTFTSDELARFRKNILNDLKVHGIKYCNLKRARRSVDGISTAPVHPGVINGPSGGVSGVNNGPSSSIPVFALIGSNYVYENPATGERTRVRKYPWGTVQGISKHSFTHWLEKIKQKDGNIAPFFSFFELEERPKGIPHLCLQVNFKFTLFHLTRVCPISSSTVSSWLLYLLLASLFSLFPFSLLWN